jgi:hypothetical protein
MRLMIHPMVNFSSDNKMRLTIPAAPRAEAMTESLANWL